MIAPARSEPAPFRLAVDINELADGLGVSVRTVHTMVENNEIPHCYIGKRCLRFNLRAVQAWLDAKTIGLVHPGHEEQRGLSGNTALDGAADAIRAASGRDNR